MPSLKPVTLDLSPSFGFGDRTGLATPGHVEAMRLSGGNIQPIFAQQSIREMTRTSRSPLKVINDALAGMKHGKWGGATGADADHLKTTDDATATHDVGFTFFTLDPSDHVDRQADNYDEPTLRSAFAAVRPHIDWYDTYLNKSITLPNNTKLTIDEQSAMRCAVKYGRAIKHAIHLADHIKQLSIDAHTDYEIELSVDETDQPTTPAEHYIIASQMLARSVKLVSLAPRFPGDFQKGIDYIGSLPAIEKSFSDHAAVAQLLGPYKLSLHSGSDKLSIYPAFAHATAGLFHVKTAGTTWLEALRVVAIHDPDLFRGMIDFARTRYDTDKATYNVTATLATTPPPSDIPDDTQLQRIYLGIWPHIPASRQILHVTFGSILTHPTLAKELRHLLESNLKTFTQVLVTHFSRHLAALNC